MSEKSPLAQRFRRIAHDFELRAAGKWFFLSTLVGIVSGLGAILFQALTQLVHHYTLAKFAGYAPAEAAGEFHFFGGPGEHTLLPWMIVVVLTLGGLVSGFLVFRFASEAAGHGTDAAIDAFHYKRGMIRHRIPIIKTIASAVTIGTGGSGGREGPIAQIGAGFGSFLATYLKLTARDRRILLAAGMGAGVGAIFRAPLAGALFAGEILYRDADLESDAIVPAAISSIIGYSVFSLSLPHGQRFEPLFGSGLHYAVNSPMELVLYAALAVVLVLVGILYIKVFYGTHRLFAKLPMHPMLRPAFGAALAGLVGLGMYFVFGQNPQALAVLGTGYGALQDILSPNDGGGIGLTLQLLIALALVKIVTTSLTISSGGSGGVFGPSMVIGGCLGGAVGQQFHQWWPSIAVHPQAYAIVGMAGFFAGVARAPFSTIIMVSEMTGDYKLLVPTMWVSTLCFILCRRWTLYVKQVPTRLESPAHKGDFIIDVLEGIKVEEVYRRNPAITFIPESMPLRDIVHKLAETHQHYFPVVDEEQRLVGIFSADDVRSYLYNETIWQLAVARDVMVTSILSVTPEDDLNTAFRRFTRLNLDELPVLDPDDPARLIGMLRRKETIAYYNRRLMDLKHTEDDSVVVR